MMNAQQIAEQLANWEVLSPVDRGDLTRRLQALTALAPGEVTLLLTRLVAVLRGFQEQRAPPVGIADLTAALLEGLLAGRSSPREKRISGFLRDEDVELVREAYLLIGDNDRGKGRLLELLTSDASNGALRMFADLMVNDPPREVSSAALAVAPLLQRRGFEVPAIFPRLFDAVRHPQLAAIVLDLANFAVRKQIAAEHPAKGRVRELAELLGQVAARLGQIEEDPRTLNVDPATLRNIVDEGVALAVSLCDALALIGEPSVTGKLYQALAVAHRRVQTEAAAALARLGQGFDRLAELAADPAARTRVLAYLDELGEIERAKPEYRTAAAVAAAQLADWLGEPSQFGAPPHRVQLLDSRRQYWPGYDERVDCRLLIYEYRLRDGSLRGVGITGPVTYSLAADLEDLPPDDIYAALAGWQAEHQELREIAAADLPEWKRKQAESRLATVGEEGYRDVALVKVGHFFEEELLIASARREVVEGTLILDGHRIEWYPRGNTRRPIGPTEAYYIHKGRKLLKAFNPHGYETIDETPDAESDAGQGQSD